MPEKKRGRERREGRFPARGPVTGRSPDRRAPPSPATVHGTSGGAESTCRRRWWGASAERLGFISFFSMLRYLVGF
ncbi:hypothetical protein ES288_A13G127000v1 [Gossypium darwinii]|uniref:Uncharacterized protein n=1 Tax=Gossypium darwinii TaxID=34276 RepID=A0A5D2DZL7_GOSDA|nr:hypothetical protein ES288_A13G127000v1 [Gossypium darwinii]